MAKRICLLLAARPGPRKGSAAHGSAVHSAIHIPVVCIGYDVTSLTGVSV